MFGSCSSRAFVIPCSGGMGNRTCWLRHYDIFGWAVWAEGWRIRLVRVVGMPDVACELPAGCATVAGRTGLWGKDLRDWVDGEVEVGWWLMAERVREGLVIWSGIRKKGPESRTGGGEFCSRERLLLLTIH